MKGNPDSKRIQRYQRMILALPEDKPFRKPDIFEALKEEHPVYIGRVINELVRDGFLKKSGADKKYSWTNKKKFSILTHGLNTGRFLQRFHGLPLPTVRESAFYVLDLRN